MHGGDVWSVAMGREGELRNDHSARFPLNWLEHGLEAIRWGEEKSEMQKDRLFVSTDSPCDRERD
jgi:hypothetical protein